MNIRRIFAFMYGAAMILLFSFGGALSVSAQTASLSGPLSFDPVASTGGGTSSNWSGYVADSASSYTSVSGSWNVPAVAAGQTLSADASWIGIGGIKEKSLIQTGTQAIVQNGTVQYEAWYELLPDSSIQLPIAIHAGDIVSASITETAPGSNNWNIVFRDTTSGQSASANVSYNSGLSSAEWIEEMPTDGNSYVPLDSFGSVHFSNTRLIANGLSETPASAGAVVLNMLQGNVAIAAASPLDTTGAGFTVTRTSVAVANQNQSGIPQGRVIIIRPRGFERTGDGVSGFTPRTATTVYRNTPYRYIIRYTVF